MSTLGQALSVFIWSWGGQHLKHRILPISTEHPCLSSLRYIFKLFRLQWVTTSIPAILLVIVSPLQIQLFWRIYFAHNWPNVIQKHTRYRRVPQVSEFIGTCWLLGYRGINPVVPKARRLRRHLKGPSALSLQCRRIQHIAAAPCCIRA